MNPKEQTVLSSAEENKETYDNLNESQKLLSDVVQELYENHKNKTDCTGIASGFTKLDSLLQGFRDGDLNIIASRPSVGKTSFALTMFSNITTRGIKALYISFEKYENELLKWLLSINSGIDTLRMDGGFLTSSNFQNLLDTAESLKNNDSIFLKTFHKADLVMLKNYIKRKIEEDKIKIVFIDYLTMITSEPTYTNRWEQVAEVSRSLKSMAIEFKIPFVVLSPLHRNISEKTPEITDLSESGSLEYEADRVIILYKGQKESDDLNNVGKVITAYIAKNRRGPKQTIDLVFLQPFKRFVNLEYENNESNSKNS